MLWGSLSLGLFLKVGKYLTNSILAQYRQVVNDLRTQDLGSIVYIVSAATQSFCNNCLWDAIGGRSSGKYNGTGPKSFTVGKCPVCKGVGKTGTAQQKRAAKATYIWLKQDASAPGVAGVSENNTVRLRLPYGYLNTVRNCQYIEVDGIKMEINRAMPVGFGIPPLSCEVLLRRSD